MVRALAFSPDRARLAQAVFNDVVICDPTTGFTFSMMKWLKAHTNTVSGVVFDPQKPNILFSCSWDCTFKIWDTTLKACLSTFTCGSPVKSIAFENNKLVAGCRSGAARSAPPAKLVLAGVVKHRPSCLGVYTLVAGREAQGWPVWKHVSQNRWIARVATGGWCVQREQDVGANDAGFMLLEDRRQVLPHDCSGEWEDRDETGWIGAPGVKCGTNLLAPPAKLVLSGVVNHHPLCLGVYTLVAGREAQGWPVWKHVSQNRCIARVATGVWMVQHEQRVGVSNEGFMYMEDRRQVLPHDCSGELHEWKEGDETGSGWIGAPGVKCGTNLPASPANLVLSGDAKHQPECFGVYTLVAGREAQGWPVWKHVSQNRWIARVTIDSWMVQHEQRVGVSNRGFMLLEDRRQVLPHDCSGQWKEEHGRRWIGAPGIKCAAASPAAPAQQVPASVCVVALANCCRARTKALERTHVHVRAPMVCAPA